MTKMKTVAGAVVVALCAVVALALPTAASTGNTNSTAYWEQYLRDRGVTGL